MGAYCVDTLKSELNRIGVSIDENALERLDIYAALLKERNEQVNLTAITDERGIALKHFADSLSLLSAVELKKGEKVIDVGTGAGFPGVALLIARPDIDITLLDGTNKKLDFIRDVLKETGLTANVLHSRAELAAKQSEYREQFSLATARAVAALNELCEFCLPFVKQGGIFASMKGAKADEELTAAKKAIHVLGGQVSNVKQLEITDCGERSIILIKKTSQTSPKYPRASAQIAKRPL